MNQANFKYRTNMSICQKLLQKNLRNLNNLNFIKKRFYYSDNNNIPKSVHVDNNNWYVTRMIVAWTLIFNIETVVSFPKTFSDYLKTQTNKRKNN